MNPVTFGLWIGLAAHNPSWSDPEINHLDNPLGVIQLDINVTERLKGYCKHTTSIPVDERGAGLNECGAMVKLW